jgi:hypothetical protein
MPIHSKPLHWQNKREAYVLPDGIEYYVGSIRTSFQCSSAGYFADIENNCQLFHVCVPQEFPDGRSVSVALQFDRGS